METSFNFQSGLRQAYNELAKEGKLSADEKQLVGELVRVRRGRKLVQLVRSHRAVRKYYLQKTGEPVLKRIDWNSIVQWIKDHWVDILKIILAVAPLLLDEGATRARSAVRSRRAR